ncbi:MAG: molybdopterin-dependent oxidoreductase [Deltaproteobacteria bacterium]|nr:molybdopterin-dependent oxidoreductase [Deltaproteobacteria bacterium]
MSDRMSSTRRTFLQTVLGVSIAGAARAAPIRYLTPIDVDNPLKSYPNRDWERAYRDIFTADSSFVFLCAPNDTHNCLLRAHVKNGVIVRIGPTFGYGKAKDLDGNTASHRWDPRLCQKGLALVRRIYGDRRVKAPMIRKGWKDWVDAGFPRDATSGAPDQKYFQRGKDPWIRLSWEQAYDYAARALIDIATTYSGKQGAERLTAQGYDPAMIEALEEAGTQTIKIRGGMAFLGATRIFGLYRFAALTALLDDHLRKVGPEHAHGARGWDSYSWHTDLPPGHPMVTGAQTNDFDLFTVENSKLCIAWGMNWITTKMPDSHWLTEARLKGTKTVAVTVEYSATASKCDEVVVIKPGTDPAFALSMAQVIFKEKLYDDAWVKTNTDLPFLVRMDTLQPLRPEDVDGVAAPELAAGMGRLTVLQAGEKPPPGLDHKQQLAPAALLADLGSQLIWDADSKRPVVVTRDHVGTRARSLNPDLHVRTKVKLKGGAEVEVRTHLSLLLEYLDGNMTPAQASQITGAPASAIESLARQIAANPERSLFAVGMGPNQFFNSDLKDRAILLVAAITRNLGFPGGNVGSYAGNYRGAIFGGMPQFIMEDPFELQLEAKGPVKTKKYSKYESLHYFNNGDRPLRVGNALLTGKSHLPTPTKAMWLNNSNSVIGNIKWHFDVVHNTLPRVEMVAFADWWWSGSCEYSDLVFACDSWAEFRHLDMTASCTNPFVQLFPKSPIKRVFDTQGDVEIIAGVSRAVGARLKDRRWADAWKFVDDDRTDVYLQRIIDASFSLKGYDVATLAKNAADGIPALVNMRTYPRASSYEQAKSEQPWHTKSGRLELYRHEREFIDSGENLVVYREPIDSTFRDPNAIVAAPHPAIRPKTPEDYGLSRDDRSCEVRMGRHVQHTVEEHLKTQHPLRAQGYGFVYHTPKYRHGAHTTPVDTDLTGMLFGPFGDLYRHDKRMPSITEGYVDIHPADAKSLKLEEGDYVFIDADPADRPYRGWKEGTDAYQLSRVMLRVRYYPGTPRGITRTWHNMYGATYGSVHGHLTRKDGLAKNPETNYQAMYRFGSHQSATRAWLKPTLMTDSLVHKDMFGQGLMKGFLPDVHCPVGAPREAFVKLVKAEDGGLGGTGLWRPAALGFRPTYESAPMKMYLAGQFVRRT